MDIGKVLKQLRIEKGLTQQELGDIIGKSKQMIINYEKNKNNISNSVLKDIATALGTTVESILIESSHDNIKFDITVKNIAIFLSFFACTLLPESTENKIIFLDSNNQKYTLDKYQFKEILNLLTNLFENWLSDILIENLLKDDNKSPKITVNKENILKMIQKVSENITKNSYKNNDKENIKKFIESSKKK